MNRTIRISSGGIASGLLAMMLALGASAQTLKVGDKAPPLVGGAWVKGAPVDGIEEGKIYVVDFFRQSIPSYTSVDRLSMLQRQFPEVVIIGYAALDDEASMRGLVAEFGERLGYRIRLDTRLNDGGMQTNWFLAAGRDLVPCSFIVDKTGTIVWIGHPNAMQDKLGEVVAGTFDFAKDQANQALIEEMNGKLSELPEDAKVEQALAIYDRYALKSPELARQISLLKLRYLYRQEKDLARGIIAARKAAILNKDSINSLNEVAWVVVSTDGVPKEHVREMIQWAQKAVDLSKGEQADALDTLAAVHFKAGNRARAVEIQKKAYDKALATMVDKQILQHVKEKLEEYQAAK